MNGRIYDPTLGRFLQADPHIQAPKNSQSLNRYSYVLNNPLSYTDPSGYFFKALGKFVKKYWRAIVAVVIAVYAPYLLKTYWGITNAVLSGAISGFVSGGIATGSLKGALVGAFTGAAFGALHGKEIFKLKSGFDVGRVAAHGAVGGIGSVLNGGKFGHGFLSAGIMQGLSEGGVMDSAFGDGLTAASRVKNAVAAAVIGGTVSAISGGKFGNGALTAVFSRLLNDLGEVRMQAKEVENGNVKFKELDTFDKKVGAAKATLGTTACLAGPAACALAAPAIIDGINAVNAEPGQQATPIIAQGLESLNVDKTTATQAAAAADLLMGGKGMVDNLGSIGKNLIGLSKGPILTPLMQQTLDTSIYMYELDGNIDNLTKPKVGK